MNREELIRKAYDRSASLTTGNPFYLSRVRAFTADLLAEDVRDQGDITTDSVLFDLKPATRARLVAKECGICAGLEEAAWFFKGCGLEIVSSLRDGDPVKKGETMLQMTGSYRDLLKSERVGLNMVQRMSGIATLTGDLIRQTQGTGLHVAATRKTPWGSLDNKAVAVGGGLTHRLGLWDAILIKDNHLVVLRENGFEKTYIEEALERAWHFRTNGVVEIEVQNPDEALQAAASFNSLMLRTPGNIAIIMFDNFVPDALGSLLEQVRSQFSGTVILFEASGNISPENIAGFGKTGVDIISMGYLTHSPKAFDISQRHDLSGAGGRSGGRS